MAAKMTYGASSYSSSSSPRWNHDVFLSFCGKDTRKNFTDHLFTALVRDGIRTFRDDDELERGEDISLELMDAIEGSRVAIIVFSENYASSTWCLNELVKILDCKKYGQTVLPVFYKVDPSDVRRQGKTFKEAFVRHEERLKEEMGKVETWKAALTEAANLSGWDQLHVANGHEAELIKKIVGEVLKKVNPENLDVAAYPVGLDSHINRISCLLDEGMDVVDILGIYGLSGVGKTTIAKAIFNFMYQKFEGCSFLANVREVSSQQIGLAHLQKQLLSDILKRKDIEVSNEDSGIMMIKERLCHKRVLIVVDDVDKTKQLDKLIGKHGWFGPGSRIIITTKDEHLLNRPEVDEKYKVEKMGQNESLQLFSYHAFRKDYPLEGYVELSNYVVQYSGGLPLALVILGSLLLGKEKEDWQSELEKLRKIPNSDILEVLKLSYDALDDLERSMFLDISCCFIGRHVGEVIQILDACGLCPRVGIKRLFERSLVYIDEDTLQMHDLIQGMGREIVRRQSPQNPGERSRLGFHDDAIDVLTNCTGTDAVECLQLNLSNVWPEKFQLTTEGFLKMPNLRLLEIDRCSPDPWCIGWVHYRCDWLLFFRNLVSLCWIEFPFEDIPNNFHLENLVSLDMSRSKLKEVWKGTKFLPKLKVLNLSSSYYLTSTPDFSGVPKLEKLILGVCISLIEVHESIDHLGKLVVLDLSYCRKLRYLPSISKLASLETLNIPGCSKLEELPEGIGNLTRLTSLRMRGTVIEEVPSSFKLLKNLTTLESSPPIGQEEEEGEEEEEEEEEEESSPLGACCCFGIWKKPALMQPQFSSLVGQSSSSVGRNRNPKSVVPLSASLYGLCSLKDLCLFDRNLTDDDIPDDLWKLSSLKNLTLCRNNFCSLPSSICQLSELETLNLRRCASLQSLPMLPSSLRSLYATACRSLEMLPNPSNLKNLRELDLAQCSKLREIKGFGNLESIKEINLLGCDKLDKKGFFQDISKDFGNRDICDIYLSGSESLSSASCQVTLPHNVEIQGLIICTVTSSPDHWVVVHNQSKNVTLNHHFHDVFYYNRTWMIKIPHCFLKSIAEFGDIINISSMLEGWRGVMKIGVHLSYTSHKKVSEEDLKPLEAFNAFECISSTTSAS